MATDNRGGGGYRQAYDANPGEIQGGMFYAWNATTAGGGYSWWGRCAGLGRGEIEWR